MKYEKVIEWFLNQKINLERVNTPKGEYYKAPLQVGNLYIFSNDFSDLDLRASIIIDPVSAIPNINTALYWTRYPKSVIQWNEIITMLANFNQINYISSSLNLKHEFKRISNPSRSSGFISSRPVPEHYVICSRDRANRTRE